MKKILFLLLTIISFSINAQVYNSRDYKYSNQMNIGKGGTTMVSTDSCAMLELGSEGINRALLLPRGDTSGIPTAKRGAIFYNIADSSVYYRTRNKWNKLSTGSGGGSSTANNGLTATGSNIELGGLLTKPTSVYGLQPLTFGALNKYSVYADTIYYGLGSNRFIHTTSLPGGGHLINSNLFVGKGAGELVASTDSAIACTGIGTESLYSLHSATNAAGSSNTALGYKSGRPMRYGVRNTILGTVAMGDCAVGTLATPLTGNIAIGHHAYRQGASHYAIAIGCSAMENANDDFSDIIAIGQYAMMEDSAAYNIGIGYQAGKLTKNGGKNVFLGYNAGANGVASEKNVYIGYLSGNAVLGVGANVAIGSGAMQGVSTVSTGNTNVVVGNNAFNAATSGSRNVFIGNNAVANGVINATSANDCIVIGNASTLTSATATNELNIGKALYGANIYSTNPRFALGKAAGINSTLDMGGCYLPIILPKNASTPAAGLESGMLYYNSNTNTVDMYDGSWGAIQRKQPFTVVTAAGGLTWNSTITPQVELDATTNAITQTIPSHSTAYTGWVVEFTIVGAASNAVTFNIPSTAMLNGVTGATTFTPSNGNVVRVRNDGSRWVITNK